MINAGLEIRETSLGLEVRLHVLPRAKQCEISGVYNGALKIKVTAPPVDGAANHAVIKFFSALLGISKSSISILAGSNSRNKTMQIKNLSLQAFLDRLEAG